MEMILAKRLPFLLLLTFFISLSSCKREKDPLPFIQILLTIVDEAGNPLEGADVELYYSELNYLNSDGIVAAKKSDSRGKVYFSLSPFIKEYYLSVFKGNVNNWGNNENYFVVNETGVIHERTIRLQSTTGTLISGKKEKSWELVSYVFNGTEYKGCAFNERYVFKSNGLIDKFYSGDCPQAGNVSGGDRWILNQDGSAILTGPLTNPLQRQIVELSASRMVLVYQEGPVTVEETFLSVD